MRRIIETTYPAKVMLNGSNRYITLPAEIMKRMGLEVGDYIDVTIRLPKTEDDGKD